jgi:hypothetical protein
MGVVGGSCVSFQFFLQIGHSEELAASGRMREYIRSFELIVDMRLSTGQRDGSLYVHGACAFRDRDALGDCFGSVVSGRVNGWWEYIEITYLGVVSVLISDCVRKRRVCRPSY